ncbi:MAG TPA: preprotein translocase subunit YajC [Tissierellaceae bacterium]|nr:preprotein translocase subunit YajC [Tissierellaceae bacterium]
MQNLGALILPIGFLAVFYFFAIRPQRKKEKEIKEMRDNLRVGDDIITIGGIYGKVLKLKDDMVTIEIGSAKTRLEMTKWAIGSVVGRNQVEKS